MLSPDERERYARHILLKEIGGPGQQRLKATRVAIVGAGGLGAPAALYLAAAGVGRLRLIDDDVVSLSNLQRQIVFRSKDAGAPKVERAAATLHALNPHVEIEQRNARLTNANAAGLLADAHLVLDGTDDFATRFAVNAACHTLGVTLISGAVGRWDGQLATFKSGITKHLPEDQRLPCYRCFVPEAPPNAETCAQVGVVGALTGVIGSMMALEAIKEIADAGESLAGRIFLFDGLGASARRVALPRDPACVVCGHG
ncbi:MAG: molybdopterin-synthase adenylyltransferase MoeB [Hyphomonadaceae bacterium JAD_PAG50586_4]|nr:MAG: molybdopterin-synthase adenylyltransferase MoeB [Hyphomonadaceae bacterium JAD_PAG50586_4]